MAYRALPSHAGIVSKRLNGSVFRHRGYSRLILRCVIRFIGYASSWNIVTKGQRQGQREQGLDKGRILASRTRLTSQNVRSEKWPVMHSKCLINYSSHWFFPEAIWVREIWYVSHYRKEFDISNCRYQDSGIILFVALITGKPTHSMGGSIVLLSGVWRRL